jgi:hypothetical protein
MPRKVTPPLASAETFQDERLKRPPSSENDIQVHPRILSSLFTKRPLILGEDPAAYDELMSTVTRIARPSDILDELLVKDVVDLTWNIERYERLKDSLLMVASKDVLTRVLKDAKCLETEERLGPDYIESLAAGCVGRDEDFLDEAKDLLEDHGFDLDSIMAQALSDKLDDIERIDRNIAIQAARRTKALAELERRQEIRVRRFRASAVDVVDVPAQAPSSPPGHA